MNSQGWFPLGLTGSITLLSKGFSSVSSSTTVQKHQFFSAQLSLWSCSPSIHDYWKNHNFDLWSIIWTFVGKVMSLLFNMVSRFFIVLLPRNIFYFHGYSHKIKNSFCSSRMEFLRTSLMYTLLLNRYQENHKNDRQNFVLKDTCRMNGFSSIQFSRSAVSNSLRPHESQHARPPCPSPTPRVDSNSCPSNQWGHPALSSSVIPFSSCPQSLPASGSFPVSQLFAWGGQSMGVSALASDAN